MDIKWNSVGVKHYYLNNMNIIFFHVGDSLPDYVQICLRQFRSENPTESIWFLHNAEITESVNKLRDNFSIIPVIINPNRFPIIDQYMNRHGNFWNITMKRLLLIADFVFEYNLKDIIILENDVLVYYPVKDISGWLYNNSHANCLLTRATDNDIIAGFAYFYNSKSLLDISRFILNKLPQYSEFINEMNLLSEYDKSFLGVCDLLPTIPSQLQYDSLHGFPYVFDPASWGQYVGGTPHNGKTPGWAETAHYIGKEILAKRYDVVWQERKPFVKDLRSGTLTPLFNLHIHSKELHKYTSYE